MTSKLTKDQLEAIRLRYERSSGGYWMVEDGCYVCDVSNTRKVNDGEDYVGSVVIADCVKGEDAEFIAFAHDEDIPRLLSHIEYLEERLKKLSLKYSVANDLLSDLHEYLEDTIYCYDAIYYELSSYLNAEMGDEDDDDR
ncbi:hypothetical protein [Bacillus glycinifermentans]|uniref:hypothetical protein n=1 Tax=Bacillus glycinifermentans TaxID=1664069 RepID=UPI0008150E66|nr:hypothetical protein [Bacillus glycinifermentans]WKB78752.1 hypothetical protein QYM22_07935 [Bacillus glycinifermentans]SCA85299.1 hypothetical protein BGLY_1476 [Bacillus glycinifermentans]